MDLTILQRLLGRPGTYFSPVDFTAAYATAETLTLGDVAGLPTVASLIANDEQIRGVLEIKPTSGDTTWWDARDNKPAAFAGGTLTLPGAGFTTGSAYIVMVHGQDKALLYWGLFLDALGNHGAVTDTEGIRTLLKAAAGIPAAVGDGQDVGPRADLVGNQFVNLATMLNATNDSVEAWIKSGSGIISFTRDLTVINTAYPCAASSTPIWCAFPIARTANVGTAIWGDGTITTIGAPVPKIATMALPPIFINDLAKLHVAGSNAGDDVDGVALTL
ncbi:MAG: hypothetical protein JRG91_20505 [Deltaproteobacteria bacterium]|nr:hypothetical protein [Deltaproteobacteria bacterium]